MRLLEPVDYRMSSASKLFTRSIREIGFAILSYCPIEDDFVKTIYAEWQGFFEAAHKHQYNYHPDTQDGYFPFGSETARNYQTSNLTEFFNIYPWGIYPKEISPLTKQFYTDLVDVASVLLNWLGWHTPPEVADGFSVPLCDMIDNSHRNLLKIIHYPPLTGQEPPGALRAAPHEDINLLTLLPMPTHKGLQVKLYSGEWMDVPLLPNSMVVNVGDMLQMCSGNYYQSTTHRVINPVDESRFQSRFASPLHLHPRDDVVLSPVYTAKSYLFERLHENGLR